MIFHIFYRTAFHFFFISNQENCWECCGLACVERKGTCRVVCASFQWIASCAPRPPPPPPPDLGLRHLLHIPHRSLEVATWCVKILPSHSLKFLPFLSKKRKKRKEKKGCHSYSEKGKSFPEVTKQTLPRN